MPTNSIQYNQPLKKFKAQEWSRIQTNPTPIIGKNSLKNPVIGFPITGLKSFKNKLFGLVC
jgi:hypothetical protein